MDANNFHKKKIAVIAGDGLLPEEVVRGIKKLGNQYVIIKFNGVKSRTFYGNDLIEATFENIFDLFVKLKAQNFNSIVCCGYIKPPYLNVNKINPNSRKILKPILNSFKFGDESVFSSILNVFKENKLEPISLKVIIPEAFPKLEFLTNLQPTDVDRNDTNRSENILKHMSNADLGQSVVVRNGSCVAVETSLGTDKMLELLQISNNLDGIGLAGGVLYKAPKINQNPFIDLPVIGERTVDRVKSAGLNGIVIKKSGVIVLTPKATSELADQLGVFIWSKK